MRTVNAGEEELPEAARREDLDTVRGRLRAALIRAGREPDYGELLTLMRAAGAEINKQTVNNWFSPRAREIAPKYLFAAADALKVSPRWLANRDGAIEAIAASLPPGAYAAVQAWLDLPVEYRMAMLLSMQELKKQLEAETLRRITGGAPDRRQTTAK